MVQINELALMKYLQKKNPLYSIKVVEVRDKLASWLSMVPQTFPHYTSHTIIHSDEIISQLSKLLFKDSEGTNPIVQLSAMECYILCASAYLHDAGMVSSDKEKAEILNSEGWKEFISEGTPAGNRFTEIARFRNGVAPKDQNIRNFLADVQIRFLLAEYIRKNHHLRARDIIIQHEMGLGQFSFDDPILKETISMVCLSHGLSKFELLDDIRFPERSDIQNEQVNVRFLAYLLRIGDLLDMSTNRACSLLLNNASTVPADSLAHWTKYQKIKHRLTAPDRIELRAYCDTQDEHRFLTDWCQWLVDEINEAGIVMARSSRHSDWIPPEISLEPNKGTIMIVPSEKASYFPSNWRFVLDEAIIFQRLMKDVYDHQFAFMRELIQNALDATRCKLYLDLKKQGFKQPDFPTQIRDDVRESHPIKIKLTSIKLKNELSESIEEYPLLTIEDNGIGMDKNIIENYLLQVGRSYYQTEEFRRNFSFNPTSKFGIGFLSVFSVSDNVTIETFKPDSKTSDGPLKIQLTGPRKYLLTEVGTRKQAGTKIDIILRNYIDSEVLISTLIDWCKKVEFPILLDILGSQYCIKSEECKTFEKQIPMVTNPKNTINVTAYPIEAYGVEGEIYVLSVTDEIERWDKVDWIDKTYPKLHPSAQKVELPKNLICLYGINSLYPRHNYGPIFSYRIDIRKKIEFPLSRSFRGLSTTSYIFGELPEINEAIEKLILKHLSESPRANNDETGWIYKNIISESYDNISFWENIPNTIKGKINDVTKYSSLLTAEEQTDLCISASKDFIYERYTNKENGIKKGKFSEVWRDKFVIDFIDFYRLNNAIKKRLIADRKAQSIIFSPDGSLVILFKKSKQKPFKYSFEEKCIDMGKISSAIRISYPIELTFYNSNNPIVKWLLTLKEVCENGLYNLTPDHFFNALNVFTHTVSQNDDQSWKFMLKYLDWWINMSSIPSELKPVVDKNAKFSVTTIYPYAK